MESKSQESDHFPMIRIRNFNLYAKSFSLKEKTPMFITWSFSSGRACKMMFTLSQVYKFKEKTSNWNRRGIQLGHSLSRLYRKRESKWEDRFYVLMESVNSRKEREGLFLFDTRGIYSSTALNSFAWEFKNKRRIPKKWSSVINRIQRDFHSETLRKKVDEWEVTHKRSYRSFSKDTNLWEKRFQSMTKYWNQGEF
jgi:hypothetical protein